VNRTHEATGRVKGVKKRKKDKPNAGFCVYTCDQIRNREPAMNPAETQDERLFTFRTALMLFCGLAVLGLAGFLAWYTSAPPQPAAPPPVVRAPETPAAPTIP
jgi:hypothetical protein